MLNSLLSIPLNLFVVTTNFKYPGHQSPSISREMVVLDDIYPLGRIEYRATFNALISYYYYYEEEVDLNRTSLTSKLYLNR